MTSDISEKYISPGFILNPDNFRRAAAKGIVAQASAYPALSEDDRSYLLQQAGMIGDLKAIEALVLDESTDINWQNPKTGKTVAFNIVNACKGKHLPILKRLGADLNHLDFSGRNLSFDIVLNGSLHDLMLADSLGVSLHLTDNLGFNLFHILSIADNPQLNIGSYLHNKGIDLTAKAKNGFNPITLDIALNRSKKLFDFYMSLLE